MLGRNVRIRLDSIFEPPYTTGFLHRIHVPIIPGETFQICLPEWIGNDRSRCIGYQEIPSPWTRLRGGSLKTEWHKADSCAGSATLTPQLDVVDFRISVVNLSREPWMSVHSFNCLNFIHSPRFYDVDMERTYVFLEDGGMHRLSTLRRVKGSRPMQFYRIDGKHLPPSLEGWEVTSPDTVYQPVVAVVSRGQDFVAGMAVQEALCLFSNREYSCVHVNNDFGDLGPGEEKTMKGRLYFMRGTLGEFYLRVGADGFLKRRE